MTDADQDLPIDSIAAANLAASGLRFETIRSTDAAFDPWFQAMTRGFYGPPATNETLEDRHVALGERRICGVWDDSSADATTPVATASSWSVPLTVPGGANIPSWAISTITVAPTHRRRGIARNLLEAELRSAVALDNPVAILTASEATIYPRFGFAPAAMRADWTIDTLRAKWIGPEPSGRVQLVEKNSFRDRDGYDILARAVASTPGQIAFTGHLWTRLFGKIGAADGLARRVARYDDTEGVPQGFVIYSPTSDHHHTRIDVHYLCTATDDAYAALWKFLLELDLVTEVTAELRSTNEAVRWQISDSRAAHENELSDHLWLRILDAKRTLESRRYSSPGTFVLEVSDAFGYANGSWLLEIDPSGTGSVRELDDASEYPGSHRLVMGISELAAAYLGATSFGTLVRAGRIEEKTAGAAVAADAAFRSDITPWLSIWF